VLILLLLSSTISYAQTIGVHSTDKNTEQVIVSDVDNKVSLEEKRSKMSVSEIIDEVSPMFDQDPALIYKISYCESNHKDEVHDGGYGKGVTGIHKRTFNLWLINYKKETGETLNYDSSYDQLKMMSWAFSKGESYRRQWSTYVAYKNGGVYAFYSRLLKKNFTVRCK